jgi:hypothetical protein
MDGWMNEGRCVVVVCGEGKRTELYSMMDDVHWIEGRGKREGIGKKRGYNDTNDFVTQMKKSTTKRNIDTKKETSEAARESHSR